MLEYILFFVGFAILIKGADLLVDGASSLARRFGISSLVIGLTIVSFGTSAPELVVNIIASLSGSADIAIGNILGSNLANILLILGVSAVIYPLHVSRGTVWKEIPLALLAIVVVTIMANDGLIDGRGFSELSRTDGLVLMAFFLIFLYYAFGISRATGGDDTAPAVEHRRTLVSVGMIIAGLVGLTLGGKWVIDGATALARAIGVSEAVIGLTIVAVGTSLPELATSAIAAYKKQVDIAVGNVVGSNIFNIFWILGISAVINPLPFAAIFLRDTAFVIGATLLLFVFMFIGTRHKIERVQGLGFIALYALYTALLFTT